MNFLYLSLILCLISMGMTEINTQGVDVCPLFNGSDVMVAGAFRWEGNLYLLVKRSANLNRVNAYDLILDYRLNGFQWDGTRVSYSNIESLGSEDQEWDNMDLRTIFNVDYPGIGDSVVAIHRVTEEGTPDQVLVASIIGLERNGSSLKTKILEDFVISPYYKCNVFKERLSLCGLLAQFPEVSSGMKSILPFPKSEVLPRRLFFYNIEYRSNGNDCSGQDCYRSTRFLLEGKNITDGKGYDLKWFNANTTAKCVDLKRRKVDSSASLTDYQQSGGRNHFDMIEFFGSKFKIVRVFVTPEKMIEDLELIKYGSIGWLFNCSELSSGQNEDLEPEEALTEAVTEKPTTQMPITTKTHVSGGVTISRVTPLGTSTTKRKTTTDPKDSPVEQSKEEKSSGLTLTIILLVVLVIISAIAGIAWLLIFLKFRAPPTAGPQGIESSPSTQSEATPAANPSTPLPSDARSVRSS